MTKEILKESTFAQDIVTIIRSGYDREQLVDRLKDYHEKDIAQSLELLTNEERKSLYDSLDPEWISNIFSYNSPFFPYFSYDSSRFSQSASLSAQLI